MELKKYRLGDIADTAVSAYPSINPSDIVSLIFEFPDISIQKQIANIWSNLDKKVAIHFMILLSILQYSSLVL